MIQRRTSIIALGLISIIAILVSAPASRLAAQESTTPSAVPTNAATVAPTATPSPTAFPLQKLAFNFLGGANLDIPIDRPSSLRSATMTMAPGTATLPFTNNGPTLIVVTSGRVVLVSDNAVVSVPDVAFVAGLVPVAASPGAIDGQVVNPGEQVFLPAGSTTSIRNDTAANATMIVVAVVPWEVATPTP